MDSKIILFVLIVLDFQANVKSARRIDARERARKTMQRRNIDFKRTNEEENVSTKALFGLSKSETMEIVKSAKTSHGLRVERLQEKYKGIEVFDASVVVKVDRNGKLTGDASGTLVQEIEEDLPSLEVNISPDEAFEIALNFEGDIGIKDSIKYSVPSLQIYLDKTEKARLVYYLQYMVKKGNNITRPAFFIDAISEEVLLHWNNLDTVRCNNDIQGFGGNEAIGKIHYGETPYCLDMIVKGDMCYLENRYVRVIDMMNTENDALNDTAAFVCVDGYNDSINGAYSPAMDAFFYGTILGKMFEDWFQTTPLREKVVLRVHYGEQYYNAFWDAGHGTFGDGNDYVYPLVGIDIVCHEVGHGVTEQSSGLIYFGQSGGLNEAFSDMLGEACENYFQGNDFLAGQGFMKNTRLTYIRSFENPPIDGQSIQHVDNFTEEMDNHHSSGVFNRVFFVAIKQKGLELRQTIKAFYHANTMYWHHLSSFQDASCGILMAVYDLGQKPTPYIRAFEDVGIETCDLTTHIRALANNKTYDEIIVSMESQPLFAFESPIWAESVSINAQSTNGDVGIKYVVGSWDMTLDDLDDIDGDYESTNSVTIPDVAETVIFFILSSPDGQLMDDVMLTAGYHCSETFVPYDLNTYFLYRCYCYHECS